MLELGITHLLTLGATDRCNCGVSGIFRFRCRHAAGNIPVDDPMEPLDLAASAIGYGSARRQGVAKRQEQILVAGREISLPHRGCHGWRVAYGSARRDAKKKPRRFDRHGRPLAGELCVDSRAQDLYERFSIRSCVGGSSGSELCVYGLGLALLLLTRAPGAMCLST